MVSVIGGRFGLDYTVSLNAPGSTGMTLINQSVSAILYDGLEAASFVGAVIRPLPGAAVVVSKSKGSYWGQVSFVDSIIEFSESSSSCLAFDTIHSLYLSNVYVLNCAYLTSGIAANPSGWALAREVAIGVDIPTPSRSCKVATMPIYVNGVVMPSALVDVSVSGGRAHGNAASHFLTRRQELPLLRCKLLISTSGTKGTTPHLTWKVSSTPKILAPKVCLLFELPRSARERRLQGTPTATTPMLSKLPLMQQLQSAEPYFFPRDFIASVAQLI